MKLWLLLGGLLAVLILAPGFAAGLIGALGTLAVTAAAQPTVWAFAAGLAAAPRILRSTR